jgi:polysaccharide pyruvyl transferase WcaK-like protein
MDRPNVSHAWTERQKNPASVAARSAPRVVLFGYSGANNTGAEALLLADVDDVRAVFGPQAVITIPSLNPANLRRYIEEAPNLRIDPLPTIFFSTLRRLVRENDLIMLVEGSTYMDTWSSAMLWAYLWTTRCAGDMGKPCLAYAVDAGEIRSAFNRRLVRGQASKTNLIITRAAAAAQRLRGWGVTAPIEVTADNAFTFVPDAADAGLFDRLWPEAGSRIMGLALVDFYLFPVVMRPWGPKEDCYKWPYYFSRTPDHRRASEELANSYAALADHLVREHNVSLALICMEELDERMARKVHARMAFAGQARIFSSREYNASKMTSILRSLDFLVTSRYHACVLSMAAQVPQIAVGHDLRLKSIYAELGLLDLFVDAHLPSREADLWANLDRVLADPEPVTAALRRGYHEHLNNARRNRQLLQEFAQAQGWEPAPIANSAYRVAA